MRPKRRDAKLAELIDRGVSACFLDRGPRCLGFMTHCVPGHNILVVGMVNCGVGDGDDGIAESWLEAWEDLRKESLGRNRGNRSQKHRWREKTRGSF